MTDTPQPPVDPYSGNLAGGTPVSGTPQPPSYTPGQASPYSQPGYGPTSAPPAYPVPRQPQYAAPPPGYAGPPPGYAGSRYPVAYVTHDPATGLPYSDKSKVVAGILQLVLGAFGAGRFYTGHTGIAVAQLLVTFGTCGIGQIWGIVDGIMILVQGGTDAQGRPLRPS
jgi:TM2 domain-containing membrane protein YozV